VSSQIATAVAELTSLSKDEAAMARLHEIERMIVRDVVAEPRHLKCSACLGWMSRLIQKAKGDGVTE